MRVVGFILQVLRVLVVFCFRFLASISTGQNSKNTNSNTVSSNHRTLHEVQINGDWYSVNQGWAGGLDLNKSMCSEKFTARQPYVHISNLYFVYDANGNKGTSINTYFQKHPFAKYDVYENCFD